MALCWHIHSLASALMDGSLQSQGHCYLTSKNTTLKVKDILDAFPAVPIIPTSSFLRICFGSLWLHYYRYPQLQSSQLLSTEMSSPCPNCYQLSFSPTLHFQALGTNSRMPTRAPHKLIYNSILKTSEYRLVPLTSTCFITYVSLEHKVKKRNSATYPRKLSVCQALSQNSIFSQYPNSHNYSLKLNPLLPPPHSPYYHLSFSYFKCFQV